MEVEGEYTRWTEFGVEVEAAEFLYAVTRMLKPRLVIESGTGEGYASKYIAGALEDNDTGKLITYEADPHFADVARKRLSEFPFVSVVNEPFAGYTGPTPDLIFLDSGPPYREQELREWLPRSVPLVVHDAYEYRLEGGVMLPGRGLWLRV